MKRLLLVCCCAIVLTALGPLPSVHAQAPQGVGSEHKHRWFRSGSRKQKHHKEKHPPLYTSPKSKGWWHHTPGPMGAGAK